MEREVRRENIKEQTQQTFRRDQGFGTLDQTYLNMIPIFFLSLVFLLLTLLSFRSRFDEVLVVSFVRVEAFGLKVDRVCGDGVEEFAVVTYHENCRFPPLEVVF